MSKQSKKPNLSENQTYKDIYKLYEYLHDSFGIKDFNEGLFNLMRELKKTKL